VGRNGKTVTAEDDDYPQFSGPLVQWPKYGATYHGQQFTIGPVPTDDGRWVLSINDWTDQDQVYPSVVAAIDGALAVIKQSVDEREAGSGVPDTPPAAPIETGGEES
jgi:hypothetical protein